MIVNVLFLSSSSAATALSIAVTAHAGVILLVVGVVIVIVAAVVVIVVLLRWCRSSATFFKLRLPVCTIYGTIATIKYKNCITFSAC